MKRITAFFVCLLVLALPFAGLAGVIAPNELFYVYDGANVLSDDTEATIVLNNDALYEACGAQIVIVTIDSAGSMQLEDYAYTLFDEWGIGSAQKNNGLLVLLEIGAEDYWYLQGSGLERNLSTGDLAEIVYVHLEPDFAKGDYDKGVDKLFEQLLERVADIYGVNVNYRAYDADDLYPQEEDSSLAAAIDRTNRGDFSRTNTRPDDDGDGLSFLATIILLVILFMIVNFVAGVLRSVSCLLRGRARPVGTSFFWLYRPWRVFRPYYRAPRPPRVHIHVPPVHRPHTGPRPSSFGKPRSGGGGASFRSFTSSGGGRSSFGSSSRSSGGSRSSFGGGRSSFGGSRSGGGGSSRGGGGGRRR